MNSEAQRLLDSGKYVIVNFDGWWHMFAPPQSFVARFFNDFVFRTGFDAKTPEDKVRDFYADRMNVQPDDIVRIAV